MYNLETQKLVFAGYRKGKEGKIPNWVEPYLDLYIKNRENETHIKKLYEELKKDTK